MRTLSIVIFSLIFGISFSQTKLISHKSHSGNNESFRISLEENLFDIGDSNLGAAPNRYERNAVLDTVIYVSKEKTILLTSEYCTESDRNDFKILSSNKWRVGKETLYNHNLFSKNHSLDSIKEVLKSDYNFKNDINKVVFIGFDNKKAPLKTKKKKKSIIPFVENKPNFPSKPLLIFALFSLATLVAFFTWKTTNFKTLASN
ncbi:hypothetical protein [Flavobacterium sp.]|uniref:hypothetical protein n=1 Tax=Flavobacterium sp. TaxID=239 RepID=UPI00375000CC